MRGPFSLMLTVLSCGYLAAVILIGGHVIYVG